MNARLKLSWMLPARVAARIGAVVAGLLLPIGGAAQAPASAVRPDFRVLRFEENWEVLRESPPQDRLERLKYLPLNRSGTVYLSLGGQLRVRGEAVDNFLLVDAPDRSDMFGLVRAMMHTDLHVGPYLRLFVEGKHSIALGRDLPGGSRPLDRDDWELQNAFVDVTCCAAAPFALTARVGRQELLLGSQRLVSPLDWSNTRRTFDGARVMARMSAVSVEGFLTRPVTIRTTERNTSDGETTFWGMTIRPATATPRLAGELYLLGLMQGDSTLLWGSKGSHDRITVGGRVNGVLGSPAARFDLEGGSQTGKLAGKTISAWFLAADVSRSFTSVVLRPVAAIGLDYASGDSDPDDDRVGTFHQLYPLAHAYAGYMDLLGRQNLIEARGVLTANPGPGVQLRASVHRFLRARTSDSAYNAAGAVLQGSPGGERAIGSELDLTAGYRIDRYRRLEVGYGHFRPAGYLQGSPAGAVASNWVYASSSFTF